MIRVEKVEAILYDLLIEKQTKHIHIHEYKHKLKKRRRKKNDERKKRIKKPIRIY